MNTVTGSVAKQPFVCWLDRFDLERLCLRLREFFTSGAGEERQGVESGV